MADILIIDDDEPLLMLISASVSALGHNVDSCTNATDGLAKAKSTDLDMIISDMNMPVMTGWELIRELKSDPKTSNIPIIVLSAQSTAEDYDEAYNAGCAAFIKKPIELKDFMEKFQSVLSG